MLKPISSFSSPSPRSRISLSSGLGSGSTFWGYSSTFSGYSSLGASSSWLSLSTSSSSFSSFFCKCSLAPWCSSPPTFSSFSYVEQLNGGGATFSNFSNLLLSTRSAPLDRFLGSWETIDVGCLGSLLKAGLLLGTKALAVKDLESQLLKIWFYGWGSLTGLVTFYEEVDLNSVVLLRSALMSILEPIIDLRC